MKVGIIGFSKTTRGAIPWDDPSWVLWGVNDTWTFAPRPLDAIFELHSPEIYEWPLRRHSGHLAHLHASMKPVYLIERRADIMQSQTYPLADVVRSIGRPYLTSSVAYALALAIHERPEAIGLWGIDLVTAHEYSSQRPCVEWLLGVAQERGIEIVLPEGCQLLGGPLYGRGADNPGGERLSHNQFEDRLRVLTQRERELTERIERCHHDLGLADGAAKEAQFWYERLGNPQMQARAERLAARTGPIQTELMDLGEHLTRVKGMIAECQFWIAQTPEGAQPDEALLRMGDRPMLEVVG